MENAGNGVRIQGIRVGMMGIKVRIMGMRGIRVEMRGIKVRMMGMRGIRIGMREIKVGIYITSAKIPKRKWNIPPFSFYGQPPDY